MPEPPAAYVEALRGLTDRDDAGLASIRRTSPKTPDFVDAWPRRGGRTEGRPIRRCERENADVTVKGPGYGAAPGSFEGTTEDGARRRRCAAGVTGLMSWA